MLARLNYVVRVLRLAARRRARREPLDLLSAEAVQARLLRARRAVGVAAVLGAAGWVMLRELPPASSAGWGERAAEPQRLREALGFLASPEPTGKPPPSRCRRPPLMV